MANVLDVAEYILQKQGKMTAMKLQKLVYYCQAWSLVWDETPLFDEKIEAWANGPVVRRLYDAHKGVFELCNISGCDPANLTSKQTETIDAVLNYYGDKSAQWLGDLTHMEKPWNDARIGLDVGANSNREITLASMDEYYSSLLPSE